MTAKKASTAQFDGTPLYRLAQAFERAGVHVSRGALGHWVIATSEKHRSRIYDALKLRLRSQTLILWRRFHGSRVQVLKEKDRKATDGSYMWAYRSGETVTSRSCCSIISRVVDRNTPRPSSVIIAAY
nr:IS66 family transposase [Ensifer sp. LCM 4579]